MVLGNLLYILLLEQELEQMTSKCSLQTQPFCEPVELFQRITFDWLMLKLYFLD